MDNNLEVIDILIIDDDQGYVSALFSLAQGFGVTLHHERTLEDARDLFAQGKGKNLAGVILDVVGLKERDQRVPDNSFIMAASKFCAEQAPHLPVVVLTGEPDQYRNLKELFRDTMGVYSKGRDEENLLTFLVGEAGKLDRIRYARMYPEVFEVIRNHLDDEAEGEFIDCLKNREKQDQTIIRNNLANLRRVQEKMYIALGKLDPPLVPRELIMGEIKMPVIYKHLAERGVVERYRIIDRFAELIFKISSDSGAHVSYTDPKYRPTPYTVISLSYAMMDLLLWFGGLVDGVVSKNRS